MMSCNSEQPRAQAGAKTNGHAHAQGAGSVSSTGADGGEASSADGNDGGEGEPPLSADPPGVEGVGAGAAQPYSLAWWRAQNFPPTIPSWATSSQLHRGRCLSGLRAPARPRWAWPCFGP